MIHLDPIAYPPRGLSREEAARSMGITAFQFDQLVADGIVPRPKQVDGQAIWDNLHIPSRVAERERQNMNAEPKDGMTSPIHRVEALTSEWPSGLKTLGEAAVDLGIAPERLQGLADGGFAPHYRIDGGPAFFKSAELKRWAGVNLVERVTGRDLPAPVRIIAPAQAVSDFRKVPATMREIVGLCDITDEILRTGIYFLCRDGALLYIGQSVNAAGRVAEHYRRYEFESVFFLPWPADDLNRIEAALIRTLRPTLNGKSSNGKMRTSFGQVSTDAEIIAALAPLAAGMAAQAPCG
jgi:hypothetical protein